jgi:hypothetical protein
MQMIRRSARAACLFLCVLASFQASGQSDRDWRKAGFNQYDARTWQDAGIGLGDATWFASTLGGTHLHQAEDAAYMLKSGVTPAIGTKWLAEFDSQQPRQELYALAAYLERDISVEDARAWRIARADASEVEDWLGMGLGAEQAREWSNAHVSDPAMVRRLRDAGFDPQKYVEWAYLIGTVGPERASEWMATGVGNEAAVTLASKGVWPALMPIIAKQCPSGAQGIPDVYLVNPYDAEGQCYVTSGRVHQLLGRTTALATHPRDPRAVIHVEFGPTSAPPAQGHFVILGKARSPFRYTTVAGSERIVASLMVLGRSDEN